MKTKIILVAVVISLITGYIVLIADSHESISEDTNLETQIQQERKPTPANLPTSGDDQTTKQLVSIIGELTESVGKLSHRLDNIENRLNQSSANVAAASEPNSVPSSVNSGMQNGEKPNPPINAETPLTLEEHYTNLLTKFEKGEADSAQTEEVERSFRNKPEDKTKVASISCNVDLCQLLSYSENEEAAEEFISNFPSFLPWNGSTSYFVKVQNDGVAQVTFFFSKDSQMN